MNAKYLTMSNMYPVMHTSAGLHCIALAMTNGHSIADCRVEGCILEATLPLTAGLLPVSFRIHLQSWQASPPAPGIAPNWMQEVGSCVPPAAHPAALVSCRQGGDPATARTSPRLLRRVHQSFFRPALWLSGNLGGPRQSNLPVSRLVGRPAGATQTRGLLLAPPLPVRAHGGRGGQLQSGGQLRDRATRSTRPPVPPFPAQPPRVPLLPAPLLQLNR